MKRTLMAVAVASGVASVPDLAEACGCFAPPTVGEPVVQAGERIVFAHQDGKVVAHIQIQYQGEASDFAWLLPLPAEPDLRLGTEELFQRLEETTGPKFTLNQTQGDGCGGPSIGCGGAEFATAGFRGPQMEPAGVAVKESSAGPYDWAVVRADDKQPMIDWLNDNGYFVPAGTQEAIDPYIRPGAYFLALKLQAGQTLGDLQPVVVEYASERPMIPIILTSVAANPNMGVLVWVLGDARAIPHNYQHVLINEEYVDWAGAAQNYADVVTRAIDETESHHAFVTEYAGSTQPMFDRLDYAGRFGDRTVLESSETAVRFVARLQENGFWVYSVLPILQRELDVPQSALDDIPPNPVTGSVEGETWIVLRDYATRTSTTFDAVAVTAEIWERVVEPSKEAQKLFDDNRMMTRMFTTLSPEEMTEDPVFAFNPDLPEVSNEHFATQVNHCEGGLRTELQLQDGRVYRYEDASAMAVRREQTKVPYAARVEILRQEGPAEIVTDNFALLAEGDDMEDGGCIGTSRPRRGGYGWALFFGLVLVGRSLLRRRR